MILKKKRLQGIFILFLISFSLLTIRLFYLQVYKGSVLAEKAADSREHFLSSQTIPRGDIVDRKGESLLEGKEALGVVVVPKMITNSEDIKKIAAILNEELEDIEKNIYNAENYLGNAPRVLKNNLSEEEKKLFEKENIPGVYLVPIKNRYSSSSLLRHFVGELQGNVGASGLEKIYNEELFNRPESFYKIVLDGKGNVIPGISFQKYIDKENTRTLSLTIDKDIQKYVERIMDEKVISGVVIVMDSKNGDILAAATRPNFKQNSGENTEKDTVNFVNKAISFYHPGSIFKLVVAAASLEAQIVDLENKFICNGKYTFPTGLSIKCWNEAGHGEINLEEAISYSCNSAFIELALKLGRTNLLKYIEQFGLKETVVLGYPYSSYSPIFIDYGPGKLANASIGQEGIRLTPIQIASFLSAIANGGYMVTPRIVEGVVDGNGEFLKKIVPKSPVQVMDNSTSVKLKNMLISATRWGTGTNAWISEVGTAGKTGSAETGELDKSGKRKINAWFAGFGPLKDPQYTIVVMVEGGVSGGNSAAPVFKEIMSFLIEE